MTAQGLFNKDGSYMSSEEEYKSPYVIDENDIINSSISMNTQGIYSWYQFFPIYEMGAQSELQYIIPAVLFLNMPLFGEVETFKLEVNIEIS